MKFENWEKSAVELENIAAEWLKMASNRKQNDPVKQKYIDENRRLLGIADDYRGRARMNGL